MKTLHTFLLTFFFIGSACAQFRPNEIATTNRLGVIKVDGVTTFVDRHGVLSAAGGGGGGIASNAIAILNGKGTNTFLTGGFGTNVSLFNGRGTNIVFYNGGGTNETQTNANFRSTGSSVRSLNAIDELGHVQFFVDDTGISLPSTSEADCDALLGLVSGNSNNVVKSTKYGFNNNLLIGDGSGLTNIGSASLQTSIIIPTLTVSNIVVSTNGVTIVSIDTNGVHVITGNSNWFGGSTYINSAFVTSNRVYLATVGGATSWANNTLYTNGPYRAVMRMDIQSTSTGSGSANQVFFHYTNNAVGRLEEAFFSLVNGNVDEREMEVELDPGATFKIDFIISTSGSLNLVNQRLNPSL